jgi:hypothetical protein
MRRASVAERQRPVKVTPRKRRQAEDSMRSVKLRNQTPCNGLEESGGGGIQPEGRRGSARGRPQATPKARRPPDFESVDPYLTHRYQTEDTAELCGFPALPLSGESVVSRCVRHSSGTDNRRGHHPSSSSAYAAYLHRSLSVSCGREGPGGAVGTAPRPARQDALRGGPRRNRPSQCRN